MCACVCVCLSLCLCLCLLELVRSSSLAGIAMHHWLHSSCVLLQCDGAKLRTVRVMWLLRVGDAVPALFWALDNLQRLNCFSSPSVQMYLVEPENTE